MTDMPEDVQDYTVRDSERHIQFTGVLLAEASSFERGKTRWIELQLYRTRGGMYILAGCGMSNAPGETARAWVQQSEDPEGVIDRLYLFNDETGAKYMPHTSRGLLIEASKKDANIRRAYSTEHVA